MNTQKKFCQISEQDDNLNQKYGERGIASIQNQQKMNKPRIQSGSHSLYTFNENSLQINSLKPQTSSRRLYKKSQILQTTFPSISTNEQQNTDSKQSQNQQQEISAREINSNHHCHFEIQAKQLSKELKTSEQQAIQIKHELDDLKRMVKNYNKEEAIVKLLQLQQQKNDLKEKLKLMEEEKQMLEQQIDYQQSKNEETQQKLQKMQAIVNDLQNQLQKLEISNKQLVQLNIGLREQYLEVQDLQRKCNINDERYQISIHKLEEILKEKETDIQQLQKKLQRFDSENGILLQEMKLKNEKLEEEKQRSKQLNADLLVMRVNKVQKLQDEIAKQKDLIQQKVEVIQQKVEEIEEQEKINKLLNDKINLQEKQIVQYKRDDNQMIMLQQYVDLLIQQKEDEVGQGISKVQELQDLNERQIQTIQSNSIEIIRLKKEVSQKDQNLKNAEKQIEESSKEHIQLILRIDEQNNEISDYKQQVFQLKNEFEVFKLDKQDQDRQLERLQEQILDSNKYLDQYKQQLDDEIKKKHSLQSEINKQKQELEDLMIQDKKEIQQLQEINESKDKEIMILQEQLQEYQDQDNDISDKLKKLNNQNDKNSKLIQQLQKEKKQLELFNQELQKQLSQDQQKKIDIQKEKQQLLQKKEEIKNDKTDVQQLNKEIEKLKADLQSIQNYNGLKDNVNQINLDNQNNELQLLLNKTAEELKEQSDKNNSDLQQQLLLKDRLEQQQEFYLILINQKEETITQLNNQLLQAQSELNKISQLKDIKIIPQQDQIPQQKNNTFHQIFVEDKAFYKESTNEEIQFMFSQINFDKFKGYLTICFWVKIDRINSTDILPILKISTDNKTLLEMGIYLDSKQVYCTFIPNNHPQNTQQQNPITVTSQLPIKFGEFQLLALILNESGKYMDMCLCLNGIRDDQVSISNSVIFPEAQLQFEKYTTNHLVIKDCLVIIENFQRINIFKELYKIFYYKYNGIKKISKRNEQKKENISYLSAGDLIFCLQQQNEQQFYPQSGSKSSPLQNQAVIINNRNIPGLLVNKYDLSITKMKTEEKKQEYIQEQPQWSRKYSINKLKKFLQTKSNYKQLLSPFIEYFDFISLGLQFLQRIDELPPTKFHKIIKPKILLSPYFMMPYNQFLKYIQNAGLLLITIEQLHELCEIMEVIYTNQNEKYIHYDHFLIVLRECIMSKENLRNIKKQEKGENKYIYKEIIIKSTDKQEQEVKLSNAQEVTEVSISKVEQQIQLQVKFKNESILSYSLDQFPEAFTGKLNLIKQKKLSFMFTNNSQINLIKTETNSLFLGQYNEITLIHEVELQENEKIVKFNIIDQQIILVIQISQKQIEVVPELDIYLDTELETLSLPQIPDNWNLGKFYINISRCQNCDKHQLTTRHQEKDFIQKTEYVTNMLKEVFPNIEIIENEEQIDKLENFEVYLKNANSPDKIILFQKQENMNKFKDQFDNKLFNLFENLFNIINIYGTTEKLGLVQEKFK
ncbi:unnamed protein product [Paramecium primaurelia]|uniref:Uncharacterized protein n=1 Tax=Paramecium primaurelia TaxID=5886 RepID=A0A8S1MCK5_PARPR|nr:unnamed protein product [Paramecium primaurelia]